LLESPVSENAQQRLGSQANDVLKNDHPKVENIHKVLKNISKGLKKMQIVEK
jgi:hypothetical protein